MPDDNVALLIDWENIKFSCLQHLSSPPDIITLKKSARRFGTIKVARAYANWSERRNDGDAPRLALQARRTSARFGITPALFCSRLSATHRRASTKTVSIPWSDHQKSGFRRLGKRRQDRLVPNRCGPLTLRHGTADSNANDALPSPGNSPSRSRGSHRRWRSRKVSVSGVLKSSYLEEFVPGGKEAHLRRGECSRVACRRANRRSSG